jgi:membrane protein YdbS with pleckstrin-like domain
MATKLLAGESMVLPTIRKHWIVMVTELFWPVLAAVVLLLTSFVPAIGVRPTGRFTQFSLGTSFQEWVGIASIALAFALGLGLLGLEFRPRGARSLGCFPGLAMLVGLVIFAALLRFLIRDLQWVVLITLAITTAIVGASAWWAWLSWNAGTMTITDQRVLLEQGVLQRAAKVIPLDRVQDVSTTQSLLGRLMDYGNVEIDTAGAIPNELFQFARHPDMLRDQVFVLSEQLRRGN